MLVRVHSASGVPLYLQIESQIKQAVAAQALAQDAPLPPVRKLAAELRINPNTVARAYQNLERDGIIRTVPGGGCYINTQAPRLLKSEKLRRLKPLATQLAVEATQVVLSREDTVQLLEDAFDGLPSNAPANSRKDRS
jgi:GntR family transcriptional regulator